MVTPFVVDASVVLVWIKPQDEPQADAALALWRRYEEGDVSFGAPRLLFLEVLNSLGRRWRWTGPELEEAAVGLSRMGLDLVEPDLVAVARWVSGGLSAYDAAYVAVAEQLRVPLVTADGHVLDVAAPPAVALADA